MAPGACFSDKSTYHDIHAGWRTLAASRTTPPTKQDCHLPLHSLHSFYCIPTPPPTDPDQYYSLIGDPNSSSRVDDGQCNKFARLPAIFIYPAPMSVCTTRMLP